MPEESQKNWGSWSTKEEEMVRKMTTNYHELGDKECDYSTSLRGRASLRYQIILGEIVDISTDVDEKKNGDSSDGYCSESSTSLESVIGRSLTGESATLENKHTCGDKNIAAKETKSWTCEDDTSAVQEKESVQSTSTGTNVKDQSVFASNPSLSRTNCESWMRASKNNGGLKLRPRSRNLLNTVDPKNRCKGKLDSRDGLLFQQDVRVQREKFVQEYRKLRIEFEEREKKLINLYQHRVMEMERENLRKELAWKEEQKRYREKIDEFQNTLLTQVSEVQRLSALRTCVEKRVPDEIPYQPGDVIVIENGDIAIIHYVGFVHWDGCKEMHVGVELSDDNMGDCDGSVEQVPYFECPKARGKFYKCSEIDRKIPSDCLLRKLNNLINEQTSAI